MFSFDVGFLSETGDKLTPDKQTVIKKMSNERLVAYLIRVDTDGEAVPTMDRPRLVGEWVVVVSAGHYKPSVPARIEAAASTFSWNIRLLVLLQ